MSNILIYFSSFEFYIFVFFLIIVGAITQSAIGIAFSNAFLSLNDVIKKDLIYSFSGRIVGSLLSIPLLYLTLGTKNYLIFFGVLLLVAVFLSVKKWNVAASKKNITIAGACSGLMGTTIGIGGPPMAIVYQNSTAKNVVATLNMFFGIGALFSVLLLVYIDLINLMYQ